LFAKVVKKLELIEALAMEKAAFQETESEG
jgi:hypothetical protein